MSFQIKRIYEPARPGDGVRVLVDRLWPRGISKDRAALDTWAKDAAPSIDLRRWFSHSPDRFDAFRTQYLDELDHNKLQHQAAAELLQMGKNDTVTLLYAARDTTRNHAVVLRDYLQQQQRQTAARPLHKSTKEAGLKTGPAKPDAVQP